MTTEENINQLKEAHDKLQEGLPTTKMAIRNGIVVDVAEGGYVSYPRFSYQFFCFRSPEMVKEMDLFIEHAKGKKCFLDIGSFDGVFSQVFTQLNNDGVAFAFEPFDEPFNRLLNVSVGKNMVCYQAALSDNSGKLKLYTGGGHLNSNKTGEDSKEVYVNAITGDSFCFGCYPNIEPDILKIDVEGMELQVLRGLQNVIAKHKPVILLELHLSRLKNEDILEIMKIIGWFDYKVLDTESGLEIPLSSLQMFKSGEKRVILK